MKPEPIETERWRQIEQLYQAALELGPIQREAFLDQACGSDAELRWQVESLLHCDEKAKNFIETPALEVAAQLDSEHEAKELAGQRIGAFEIVSLLGAGGMGEVYQARDTKLGRTVALKILAADVAADQERMRRFLQEARAAAALNHPNVATIYEVGESEGRRFIAMEYVEGETLAARIGGGPLECAEIVEIAVQVADALEAAHEKGITHRDIKPSNVMINSRGQVKVLDFGLAKMSKPSSLTQSSDVTTQLQTEIGVVMGTIHYMSPEQALGRELDHRTDLFSLGVVLYEMTAGRLPFSGTTATEIIDRILHSQPDAVSRFNYSVPDELERIIGKCLEKDPERRYQSARELRVDLERLSAPSPLAALQSHGLKWSNGWQIVRSHWRAVTLVTLVLTAAVVLLPWFVGNNPVLSFNPRDWVLIADFDNQTGDPLFDKTLSTAFAVSLEQSPHANVFPKARIDASLQRMGKTGVQQIGEALGREICQRENVRGLIACAISRIGQQYALSARLINPHSGDIVRSYLERANGENQILEALGSMATAIRRDLGESLASVRQTNRPLPQVTTASLPALKLYVSGMFLWGEGQYNEAVKKYESALNLDPDFAMAHAKLGSAYCSHIFNEPVKCQEHIEQALRLSERTTERESLYIRASHAHDAGHHEEAAQLYRLYLQAYPDDYKIRGSLAYLFMRTGHPEEAIREYKELLRIAPNDADAYINLATSYKGLGKYAEALDYYAKGFGLKPESITSGTLNHEYGFTCLLSGNEAKAREVFAIALAKPDFRARGSRSLALLELYKGRHREARTRLQESILDNEAAKRALNAARDHLFMSIVMDGQGNWAGRLGELDKVAKYLPEIGPKVWLGARLGVGYVRAGALHKAAQALEIVRKNNQQNSEDSSNLHQLEGELELARGNRSRARDLLLLADRENGTPLTIESLAHAYSIAGNTNDAIATYETLIGMREGSMGWEPQQAWFAAHYDLAQTYSSHGQRDKARNLVGKLLDMWKEADPDLPLLKKALFLKQQLER